MKHILLTFDYELFLGKQSGTVENCLLKPTKLLLETLKRHKAKSIFFIDTTYLMRMNELKNQYQAIFDDLENIKKQLIQIVQEGHYLFHHLHPHWLDAKYDSNINQWDLSNTTHFYFHTISDIQKTQIWNFSANFLNEIFTTAKIETISNGYRAGGLFIEPFLEIKPYFEQYGVKYDFSAVSKIKKNQPYFFDDTTQELKTNGQFIEYPISEILIQGITKILNGLYYRFTKEKGFHKKMGDGTAVSSEINNKGKTIKNNYFTMNLPISVELLNPILLSLYNKQITRNKYTHFLSHPKLLSYINIKCLDKLLNRVSQRYELNFDFELMN
ncbi:MAG: hypothetical protein FWC39_00120 [Bacteroidetes bacterium]|nr:hypothetical protein [Bacteroidota bacterium]